MPSVNARTMSHGRNHSRRFCSFKGCTSDILKTRDGAISFFSFPVKDTERCSAWITNCGREEFRYLTPKELADKRICELHFETSSFSNFFKTNLKKHAVPTSWSAQAQSPELIEIEIDDDSSNDGEVVNVSENQETTQSVPTYDQPVSASNNNESGEVNSANGGILNSTLLNGHGTEVESSPVEPALRNEQSPSVTSTLKNQQSNSQVAKRKKNTKFHNLPPETTHTDFYFQHCADFSEDANTNSMPEPPDGELPLFVQQDSAVSVMEEPAELDIAEPPHKRRRRERDDDDWHSAVKHLKNITAVLASENEFDLFGRSVALQLKKMSLCTALSVQAKIQSLLSHHRIDDIKREARMSKAVQTPVEEHCEEKQDEENHIEEKKDNENCLEDGDLGSTGSPQLSLTCASEHSENEVGQ